MNVVVLTSSLGYREYNTTLMTMDGWTDSHGTDRHPTVVDERVNIGPFMAGDDHLYADIYYHDDEVDRIGADPDPKPEREPEFLARKKLLDKRHRGALLYMKVGELVVVDGLEGRPADGGPTGRLRGRPRRGRPLLGRRRRGGGRRDMTSRYLEDALPSLAATLAAMLRLFADW